MSLLDSRILDSCVGVCQFVEFEAVQLKMGRCHLCVREKKRSEQRHAVCACSVCRVRLCKVTVLYIVIKFWSPHEIGDPG